MRTTKPLKLASRYTVTAETGEQLTSAEIGKLWVTYMGNSMGSRVLSCFIQLTEDQEIKDVLEHALSLAQEFQQFIHEVFTQANHPIPVGFTERDVNMGAPRLFLDEFYLHYLGYIAKAGISLYGIAVPLMTRFDIREFFTHCLDSTIKLLNQVHAVLTAKGLLVKPPYIPIPNKVDFVKKQSYFNGFFGEVRPVSAIEIAHLFDNIQNNATSKAVLIAFSQTAQSHQIKEYFIRGKSIAQKHIETCSGILHKDDIPSPSMLDHMVTSSTKPLFSDKLMLAHKIDMFAMRIRTYGNSMALCARHDVAAAYVRLVGEVGNYLEDGANLMIESGWLEQVPQAVNRNELALK